MHPNEALLREKELLADEAGVDLDELVLDIDWGDMTPEPMAHWWWRRQFIQKNESSAIFYSWRSGETGG